MKDRQLLGMDYFVKLQKKFNPDPRESAMILVGWIRICIGNAEPDHNPGEMK
jgi:hypothetical protein